MKKTILLLIALFISFNIYATDEVVTKEVNKNSEIIAKMENAKNPMIEIQTTKGSIYLELYEDETPNTVANFIELIEKKYYDGLKFHRVINNFMIQGGCPLGTGTGGPGYRINDEFSDNRKHNKPGVLSMANSGPNSNGSQFFITHKETHWLNYKHSVFGQVIHGQDIVNSIVQNDIMKKFVIHQKRDHNYKARKFAVRER